MDIKQVQDDSVVVFRGTIRCSGITIASTLNTAEGGKGNILCDDDSSLEQKS